nr:UDP-glucose 4-epimerase GalE [Oceanococcus sp. HetDA_MAG_MS8]
MTPISARALKKNTPILVTGGSGYIGSHTVVALIEAGLAPVVVDNFSNSCSIPLKRIQELTGHFVPWVECDVRDQATLRKVFQRYKPQAVFHFAGLKSVAESVAQPTLYYRNNVEGTWAVLDVMREHDCRQLVFSSSATVYGSPQFLPYTEDHPVAPMNPYGQSKAMSEQAIADMRIAWPELLAVSLRYFNPVGAHPSGCLGENPRGTPNNLMPFLSQVAVGRRPYLQVFGTDYPTVDGSGVRDYIHVSDLAQGHVAALQALPTLRDVAAVNLGTGHGVSVLQMVRAFSEICGRDLPWKEAPRRAGDLPEYFADVRLAKKKLGWEARQSLKAMCADTWNWQQSNPEGY